MKSKILHFGMWQIPYKATDILCPDGKYRTVRITRDADTFSTLPAQCQVRGFTVTGFISHRYNQPEDEMSFWGFGRNMAAFFPVLEDAKKFIDEQIIPNKQIEDYELRDIFHGKWIIQFTRDLKSDWTGETYSMWSKQVP